MIQVYVLDNGDTCYRCSECDEKQVLDFGLHESPFWDMYAGQVLLYMLGHYLAEHQKEVANGRALSVVASAVLYRDGSAYHRAYLRHYPRSSSER